MVYGSIMVASSYQALGFRSFDLSKSMASKENYLNQLSAYNLKYLDFQQFQNLLRNYTNIVYTQKQNHNTKQINLLSCIKAKEAISQSMLAVRTSYIKKKTKRLIN